jgi:sulfite exporter TauE/SafE
MNVSLVLAGVAMGMAASPHCMSMCGAPCAALTHGCRQRAWAFHLGRLSSYMVGGAVVAGSISWLAAMGSAHPVLRLVWTLLHLGFLAVGLSWLFAAKHPDWMMRPARNETPMSFSRRVVAQPSPWRPGLAGLAWVAWPCAALQGALLLSALAASPLAGALVMGGFALGSMPALVAAPWAWAKWQAWRGRPERSAGTRSAGLRVSGAVLVMSSGWALAHEVWARISPWCQG